jgi:hypothetical protein
MSWGIGLALTIGLMATPAAFAQDPVTPAAPAPPTVVVPAPPDPPEVNPPPPPNVAVPEPPTPVHVDPPPPPTVGVPDPPQPDQPDTPQADKASQPKADNQAPPIAGAKAKPPGTQPAKPQATVSRPAPRLHIDPKPKRLTAAPGVRSKAAPSSPRSDREVTRPHVASAAVVGPTSLGSVSGPIHTGRASHPRPAAGHAPAVAAQASSSPPRALTLNGSRERIELTLAFALLFPALVAFMIGRTLARGSNTKDRYHL